VVQRTRNRYNIESRGRRYGASQISSGGTFVDTWNRFDRCIDEVQQGDGHNLSIRKVDVTGGIINTDFLTSGPYGVSPVFFDNWRYQALQNPDDFLYDPLAMPDRPLNTLLAAKLLAGTNPSRPVVDLPIFVYELREIPDLLRKEGGGWLRKLASTNLKYHFGIKPLVSDLLSLLNFSDEVAKREKELNALASSGLRRRRHLWSGVVTGSTSRAFQTLDFNTGTQVVPKTTASRVWGFVEWFPSESLKLMKGDHRALARKAVLGLTVDFSTAWNAIPWSWLIDWCSNVGDILIAHRNIVGAYHGPIRIMETTTTHGNFDQTLVKNVGSYREYGSPFHFRTVTKTRRTSTASLSAHLPILSARQLSILGSIAVTRRMPRSQ